MGLIEVEVETTAVTVDDAHGQTQPNTTALANFLGREKGLKDFVANLSRHALTAIDQSHTQGFRVQRLHFDPEPGRFGLQGGIGASMIASKVSGKSTRMPRGA
jgi:hypothetical protein